MFTQLLLVNNQLKINTDAGSYATENDTGISDTIPETGDSKTLASDTRNDTETRYTPAELTIEQLTGIVKQMVDKKMSQTQIIQSLWGVEKNGKGWKQAYTEYKELFS